MSDDREVTAPLDAAALRAGWAAKGMEQPRWHARLVVGARIARQATANLAGALSFGQNGDPMVRSLTMPDRAIAGVVDRLHREFGIVGLELLQTDDVRAGFG